MKYLLSIIVVVSCVFFAYAFKESELKWQPLNDSSDALVGRMEKMMFEDRPQSEKQRIVSIFTLHGKTRQARARSDYWRAMVMVSEDIDTAQILLNRALQSCDSVRFPYDYARFRLLEAMILYMQGQYAPAYMLVDRYLPHLRKTKDRFWEAKYTTLAGLIMHELRESHEALRLFKKASDLFSSSGSEVCQQKNSLNTANALYILGKKEEAMNLLKRLETDRIIQKDSNFLVNVLISRYHISDYKDGGAAIRADSMSRMLKNPDLRVLTLESLSHLYYTRKDYSTAINAAREGLYLSKENSSRRIRYEMLGIMGECFKALGMSDSAAVYHAFHEALGDSLFNSEPINEMKRREHLATIQNYEQQITSEREAASLKMTLLICVSALTLAILILLLILFRLSARKSKLQRDLELEKIEKLKLLNERYCSEIDSKNQLIASKLALIDEQNASLKKLATQLNRLKADSKKGGDSAKDARSVDSDAPNKEDDWQYFKLKFENVNSGFFDRLHNLCPGLTRNETRICAYIRIGMSAKEMAQILNVLPETVNTSRYRIRKRLSLPADISLDAFISTV